MIQRRKLLMPALIWILVLQSGYIFLCSFPRREKRVCHCSHMELEEYQRRIDFNKIRVEMTHLPNDHIAPDLRKVFTYYQSMSYGNIKSRSTRRLLKLWLRAWYHAGYDPVILTPIDASLHPKFHELRETFERFPTVNNLDYEVACYMRWLAFRMAGGGTLVDYDVLPLGKVTLPQNITADSVVSCKQHLPMITTAGPFGVEKQIHLMANYKGPFLNLHDCPHISDMYIMRNNTGFYTHLSSPCPDVIHYSNYQYDKFKQGLWTRDEEGRDGFAADYNLMTKLIKKKVWMILPKSIRVLGEHDQFGLGLRKCRARRLIRHLKRRDAFEDEVGKVGPLGEVLPSESDLISRMGVNVTHVWPQDIRRDDIIFVVFDQGELQTLDENTERAIKDNWERIIPLWAGSNKCQLVIDYSLGNAAREDIIFKYRLRLGGFSELEANFKQKFDDLVLRYITVDQQVDHI